MRRAMLLGFAAVPCLLTSALLTGPATAGSTAGSGAAGPGFTAPAAPDGPGATSYLDLGRKDCLGTARNTTSKVWYPVAGGTAHSAAVPTNVTQVTAGAGGTFSVTLPAPAGGWVVTAASTAPSGATGYAQVTITAS